MAVREVFVGVRYSTLMYWLQKRRKGAAQGEGTANSRNDHPRWLEARVEGEKWRAARGGRRGNGCGIRMVIGNRTQATLAGEVLRAIGLGRGMLSFSGSLRVFVAVEAVTCAKALRDFRRWLGTVLKEEVKSGALFAFS